jgi:uncharacterized protein (TIGR03435 family)
MTAMKALMLLFSAVFLFLPLKAQETQTPVGFEVASIKPTPNYPPYTVADITAGVRRPVGLLIEGDRVEIHEMTLRFTLGQAYSVAAIYVFGEDWLDTKFDIAAKLPVGASAKQVPEMLQALLTERFSVRLHKEVRSMPIYVLTVAKNGLKLKELPPDTPNSTKNAPGSMISVGPLAAIGAAGSFAGLRRPLIDQTGLTGKYEIPLNPALIFGGTRDNLDDSDALARMQEAVQPLGLNISRAAQPTQVVVIDHIEHTPASN